MRVNRLEAHDRLLHLKKDQSLNISQGAQDCLQKNKLSIRLQERSPYIYIFAHPRTADDGVNKRMYWQPRLTRPTPQTNSYLFRARSHTDIIEICWLLPPQEYWGQSKKGNVTEDELVTWSIHQFQYNFASLATPYEDDLSDNQVRNILKDIGREIDEESKMKKWETNNDMIMLGSSEPS